MCCYITHIPLNIFFYSIFLLVLILKLQIHDLTFFFFMFCIQEKIRNDIKEAGFDVEQFQKSGILIDSEADTSIENDENRYNFPK